MGFFNWVLRTLEKLGEKIITLGGGLSGKIKVAALRIKNKRMDEELVRIISSTAAGSSFFVLWRLTGC